MCTVETEEHWRLLSSVAKAWGEGEPDCILVDDQGQHHLTYRRLLALRCPLLATLEALTSWDEAAVSLPAPTPVVEGLLKMMAGQPLISNDGHFLEEVVSLSLKLGIGKPEDFLLEETSLRSPDTAGSGDFSTEDDWGPILEAVVCGEEEEEEENNNSMCNDMVSIELSEEEDICSTSLDGHTNILADALPDSGNQSAEKTHRTVDKANPPLQNLTLPQDCHCPKRRLTRGARRQSTCNLCQSNKKSGRVSSTRKRRLEKGGPAGGLAEGWQDGQRTDEVLGVKEGRWRGPRFPCNQCKYVACRQTNLDNHKASKHEGVMFLDNYITNYFAKNKLIFI